MSEENTGFEKERFEAAACDRMANLQIDVKDRKRAEEDLYSSLSELEKSKTAALNLLEDLRLEIDERKRAEETLRLIAESVVPSGEDIFRFLVRQTAISLNKRHALIAVIEMSDPGTAHTIAVWSNGKFTGNFSYQLAGTPCHNVITAGPCLYPANVCKLFPEDKLLAEMMAESYWGTPMRDSESRIIGIMAVIDDRPIDESSHALTLLNTFAFRASAEIERRKTDDNYKTLFREMLDGFAVHEIIRDGNGNPVNYRFLSVNPAFERIIGLPASDIIGKTVLDVLPETEHFWIETYGKVATTGEPIHFESYSRELNRHFGIKAFRPQFNQFACIITDISDQIKAKEEKTRLEDEYRQSQKMESVGRLAGGVAHDFNNMLSITMGYAEMALKNLDPSSRLYEIISEIADAGRRSSDLVRQLLTFARKQTIEPKLLDLNKTVAGMSNMLRKLIGENIDLVWSPDTKIGPVIMDPAQLDQIMVNLAINARDSISGIGKITIETRMAEIIDNQDCGNNPWIKPGNYIVLSVSDNGCGMDKETAGKIFEPFFTTKEKGKGTGLGLSTVYGIVKQNNGVIKVCSEPGEGTTFKIYLPCGMIESVGTENSSETSEPEPGNGTILLVEDEEPLLEMIKLML